MASPSPSERASGGRSRRAREPARAAKERGDWLGRLRRVAAGEALLEPHALDEAGDGGGQVARDRPGSEPEAEVLERACEHLQAVDVLELLVDARAAHALAPEAVRHDAQPQGPEDA